MYTDAMPLSETRRVGESEKGSFGFLGGGYSGMFMMSNCETMPSVMLR